MVDFVEKVMGAVVIKIIMVGKYCFVIYFLAHVETDILLYVMSCNVTALQLIWYSFRPGLDGRCDPEDSHGYLTGLEGVHK
jgi:hypothetical protein